MRNARHRTFGRQTGFFVALVGIVVTCSLIAGAFRPGIAPPGRVAAQDGLDAAGTPIGEDSAGETPTATVELTPDVTATEDEASGQGTPTPAPEPDPTEEAGTDGDTGEVGSAGTPVAVSSTDGEFSVTSVEPTGELACSPANNYGPNDDGAVPGEILHYECTLPGAALSILSGSVSLTDGAPDGWQFRLIYNVQIALLDTTIDSGWTTSPQNLSGLALLSGGSMRFYLDLRAPSSTQIPSSGTGDSRATLVINASASGVGNCGLLGACSGTATINAYAAMTASSSGGGQLLGAISGVAGLTPGEALFAIDCDAIPNNHTVAPGTQVAVNCQFRSLAALATLFGLATLSTDLTLTSTNAGWDFALAPGQNADFADTTGHGLHLDLGNVVNAGVFNNGWFTVFFTPTGYCGPVVADALDSMMIEAAYDLTLASLLTVPVSNGYAVVPVQVAGDGDIPAEAPAVGANALNFGTFTYDGSGYTGGSTPSLVVDLSAPVSDCIAADWHVTAAYSPLTGYADAGHVTPLAPATSISVSSISYGGLPTGGSGTVVPLTSAPTGGADVIITGTDDLGTAQAVTYTLQLAPPDTQRVGFYRGTVTITAQAGAP